MTACERCAGAACEHHALLCRALGLKDRTFCFSCLAAALEKSEAELTEAALGYVAHRDCHLGDWLKIGTCSLGGGAGAFPCLPLGVPEGLAVLSAPPTEPAPEAARPPADWCHERSFDGGEAGCGELLFDLRLAFRGFAAGDRILVVARDAGAPLDLPAWCRITGHLLLDARHPYYLVQKRTNPPED